MFRQQLFCLNPSILRLKLKANRTPTQSGNSKGAAADMLNASIIVRELGLMDRQNVTDDSFVPVTSITYVEVDASQPE